MVHCNTLPVMKPSLLAQMASCGAMSLKIKPHARLWNRVCICAAGGKRAHVGIATFDATVHYYSLRPSQSQAHMLVIPDAAEPYSPLPESVVVPLHSSRSMVSCLGLLLCGVRCGTARHSSSGKARHP